MRRPHEHCRPPAEMPTSSPATSAGHEGRTLYVVPFSRPAVSPRPIACTSDSAYVAVTRIYDRMVSRSSTCGDDDFGARRPLFGPRSSRPCDVPCPCDATTSTLHFPETREIWSYARLRRQRPARKKCFALRIAHMARDGG